MEIGLLLGGAALAASFAILLGRRGSWLVAAYAAQAWILAAMAAWQGWMQAALAPAVAGLLALAINGVAVPAALRRIPGSEEATPAWAAPAGLALVAVAALALQSATPAAQLFPRAALIPALSVVLLGLLAAGLRRDAPGRLVGLLSLGNGIGLAAIAVPDLSGLAPAAVASSGLLAAAAIALRS